MKNKKLFLYVFVVFTMLFSFNNKALASTITYSTYGGSNIDSTTIDDNTSIGVMPVPTKSGKLFSGWYLEDTFDTKVTSSYVVTSDITLHAKWEDEGFPIVWKKLRECTFNGKDYNMSGVYCQEYSTGKYIDTGIGLYNSANHDKDYEIGVVLEHYDPEEQDSGIQQQTIISSKLEGNSYPGAVFRRTAEKLDMISRKTSSKNANHAEDYANWKDVRLFRIDNSIYYTVDGGEKVFLTTLANFNPVFDLNVWFGAAPKDTTALTAQRYLTATLSNMYIKLGDYEEKANYKVYKPDGTIDEVEKYSNYLLSDVDYTKNDKNIATVTFNYHNGDSDTVDYVKTQYINNGITVFDTDYEDTESFKVINDAVLYPKYVESTVGVTFPSNPTKEHYTFAGWYTLEDGGELVTSYNEASDITLHAHWDPIYPTDFVLDVNSTELAVGETHQINVTFTPSNESDTLTFSDYDSDLISISSSGLVTALSSGTTTVIVGLEHVPGVTKTLTINIISNKLESSTYDVREATGDKDRIIIGMEPDTSIGGFKDDMNNPNIDLKVYHNSSLVSDSSIVKTGLVVKLEYHNNELDEAIMVLRGDNNKDGIINDTDYKNALAVSLELESFNEYATSAASDVEEDDKINVVDTLKIMDFILENINSLN